MRSLPLLAIGLIGLSVGGVQSGAIGLLTAAAPSSDEEAAESSESRGGPIRLEDCRITLIDEAVLASDRPGTLEFVEPEAGDRVESGQEIARLRDKVVRAQLAVHEKRASNDIEIRYAQKAAEVAQVKYKRNLAVNKRAPDAVGELELLELKLSWERSELQIENAEFQREISKLEAEQAKAKLETYRIVAPFSGIVTEVQKHQGEAVRQGDPILTVVNTDRVHINGEVNVVDVLTGKVRPGSPVQVRLNVPGAELEVEERTFEGRIVFVDPTAIGATDRLRNAQLVNVRAEVANPENVLIPGMKADMTILPADQPVAANAETEPTVSEAAN